MGRYSKGEHVKIEVVSEASHESEWMWLLVDRSDDDTKLVFGKLDSEPVVMTDMRLGHGTGAGGKLRQDQGAPQVLMTWGATFSPNSSERFMRREGVPAPMSSRS